MLCIVTPLAIKLNITSTFRLLVAYEGCLVQPFAGGSWKRSNGRAGVRMGRGDDGLGLSRTLQLFHIV